MNTVGSPGLAAPPSNIQNEEAPLPSGTVGQGVRRRRVLPAAIVALLSVGALLLASGIFPRPTTSAVPESDSLGEEPAVAEGATSAGAGILDASSIAQTVIPSVVTVQVGAETPRGVGTVASGSGVILDAEGHIVTNEHVVAAGSTILVVLTDGRIYPAQIVGTDPITDLAVLEIDAGDLTPIALGSTERLEVGDPAVAVGSPLGLEGSPSLTVGVISALEREVQTDATVLYGLLQTDAPITQGSSGGALVDASGRLVGITTAVGVSSIGVEGIGFATPVEIVSRVAQELIDGAEATQPYLGITGTTDFQETADGGQRPTGVRVDSVQAGGSAADAGLEPGDVITAIEGTRVDTIDGLISRIRRFHAGDTVDLTVLRRGSERRLAVELADR